MGCTEWRIKKDLSFDDIAGPLDHEAHSISGFSVIYPNVLPDSLCKLKMLPVTKVL